MLAVHLAPRANQRVAMLLAQLTVLVAMPTVQTWLFEEKLPGERRPSGPLGTTPRTIVLPRRSVTLFASNSSRAKLCSRELMALLELLQPPGHRRALASRLEGGSLFLEALPGYRPEGSKSNRPVSFALHIAKAI